MLRLIQLYFQYRALERQRIREAQLAAMQQPVAHEIEDTDLALAA